MRLLRNPLVQFILAVMIVGGLLYAFLGVRMTTDDLFISAKAEPLFCITGELHGEVCEGGIPFTNSLLMTLIVDLILVAICFLVASRLKIVPTGVQNIVETLIEAFYNFALGVDRKHIAKFFPLPATIFLFFLIGNLLALVPGSGSIGLCEHHGEATGEIASSFFRGWPGDCPKSGGNILVPFFRAPAADLNVSLAFALVAVFMVEYYGFQALGIGYLGKFFNFREGFITALVGVIEFISEIMRIISFAFRIFGNIFGGEVVLVVMAFLFPYFVPLPFYGLELFVAVIQAVIFAVLTLVFFSLAVQSHGHDDQGHELPEGAEATATHAH